MSSMKVEDLLNPITPAAKEQQQKDPGYARPQERPTLPPLQTQLASMQKPCKQKTAKDAPVWRKGPTKGDVNYIPHEAGNNKELEEQFKHFHIFPRGEIGKHCHHIPYSSDKKTFLSKTGRDAFEVFQYTFKVPNDDREYVVMWDYNIGLVRVTPFFKCCKYSKTTPAKVLNMNPGLREITHSITGGALTAQGYWMPFECAKAVAATFCYDLRYALVPVFGEDFPAACVPSNDSMHGNFKIDPEIIKICTAETRSWLQRADTRFTPASSREASEAPGTPRSGVIPPWKKIRPRLLGSGASPESGYETGTEASEGTPNLSPHVPQTSWQPINAPRAGTPHSEHDMTAAASLLMLSSPKVLSSSSFSKDIPRSMAYQTTPEKKDVGKRAHHELEEESEGSSNGEDKMSIDGEQKEPRQADSKAAQVLLGLRSRDTAADTSHQDEHREKRQRHSSVPAGIA